MPRFRPAPARVATMAFALVMASELASAQLVVSANDPKLVLDDGATSVVANPPADTVTVIDLGGSEPRVVGEVAVPTSLVGPPGSVAIAPDESIALVTASSRIDPADPTSTVSDDRVTVLDLGAGAPAVLTTLQAGAGASGVSFNRAGTLALVANRGEGTISVFTVDGTRVSPAGKVDLGAPESGPCQVVFTRDGTRALVTRNGDSLVSVLTVDGSTVTYSGIDVGAGLRPYAIEVVPDGRVAVVANIGAGQLGGVDTLSVIDLTATVPRVVGHTTVGHIPEGLAVSADGQYVAVTLMHGSNVPASSPIFSAFGLLTILRLDGMTLTPLTNTQIGRWCQGVAWSRDGRTLLAQCGVEQEIQTYRFDGQSLTRLGTIPVRGVPGGLRSVQY